MAVLHLDNFPAELYQRIEELARADRVSVGEEAVKLLHQAVSQNLPTSRADILPILAEMRRNAIVPPPGTPDSVELLREDRNR